MHWFPQQLMKSPYRDHWRQRALKGIPSGTDSTERLAFQQFGELLCRGQGRGWGEALRLTQVTREVRDNYSEYVNGSFGCCRCFKALTITGASRLSSAEEIRGPLSEVHK